MGEPTLCGGPATNVYNEHEFKVRITFGASTASTWRARDVVVERPSATTVKLTFPKAYQELTTFAQSWKKATGADPVGLQITTDNLATTGDITLTSVSLNSAGTATAPANGDVVYLEFGMSADDLNNRFTGTTA